jgi:hypothetical protein
LFFPRSSLFRVQEDSAEALQARRVEEEDKHWSRLCRWRRQDAFVGLGSQSGGAARVYVSECSNVLHFYRTCFRPLVVSTRLLEFRAINEISVFQMTSIHSVFVTQKKTTCTWILDVAVPPLMYQELKGQMDPVHQRESIFSLMWGQCSPNFYSIRSKLSIKSF